jgi:hypothetical protein
MRRGSKAFGLHGNQRVTRAQRHVRPVQRTADELLLRYGMTLALCSSARPEIRGQPQNGAKTEGNPRIP